MFVLRTCAGTFLICKHPDGDYELSLDGEGIGKYQDQQEAVDALVAGVVFQPHHQTIDFEELNVPRDLTDWEYVYS